MFLFGHTTGTHVRPAVRCLSGVDCSRVAEKTYERYIMDVASLADYVITLHLRNLGDVHLLQRATTTRKIRKKNQLNYQRTILSTLSCTDCYKYVYRTLVLDTTGTNRSQTNRQPGCESRRCLPVRGKGRTNEQTNEGGGTRL